METNYYMQYKSKTCKCCNRTDKQTHIGKSSCGWTFSFKGYREDYNNPKIISFSDWFNTLKDEDAYIINEYNEIVEKDDFFKLIYEKEKEKNNHAKQHKDGNWLDEQGNSFSGGEFS